MCVPILRSIRTKLTKLENMLQVSSFYYLKDPRHMYKMCLMSMRVYNKT